MTKANDDFSHLRLSECQPIGCKVKVYQEMPIPDFQSIMLPLLRVMSDGQEHSVQELRNHLAREFSLNEEELEELIPSGKQPVFTQPR